MSDSPLQLALRELRQVFTTPAALLILAAVALVLGLSGPFGTYFDMGPLPRVGYWAAVVFLTYSVGSFTGVLVSAVLKGRVERRLLGLVIGGVVAGVPVTATVLGFNWLVYGRPTMPPAELWVYCTAISVVVVSLVGLASEHLRPSPITSAADIQAVARAPAILARLPAQHRGQLLALSVADHYVEVITDRGKALVLMRLSDAIRETEPVAGLQIHRSHWVALDAVTRTVRTEGKLLVELSNGARLPVSRSYQDAARQAGIFA